MISDTTGVVSKFTQSRGTTTIAGSTLTVVPLTSTASEIYYNNESVIRANIPQGTTLEITGKQFNLVKGDNTCI